MPYIFGKLWHLSIIWAIRKAFQCILQGVRILLAKYTRISPTSENDSYRPPKDNIANIYVFIKLLPWEWEGQGYGIKKGHSLQNKLQSKSSFFPSLNFSCFKRVLCIFIGWTESVSQWLLNYSSGRCTQRAYTLSDNLFHFTFSEESHDGVGGR